MKSITILKKDATILHDGIVAHTPDGRPVFIIPASVPAPQLDLHPQGMIVYSVPEQQFPPFVAELLSSEERMRFAVCTAPQGQPDSPRSELRTHQLDLGPDDTDNQQTG